MTNLITKGGCAALVLLFITTISVYKPWGKIKSSESDENRGAAEVARPWKLYLTVAVILIVISIVVKHLAGGGMHGH